MSWSIRSTYALLVSIVLLNAVLWLDSLDRYVSTRYHFELQAHLQEEFFYPSRYLLALTGKGEGRQDGAEPGAEIAVAALPAESHGATHHAGEAGDAHNQGGEDHAHADKESGAAPHEARVLAKEEATDGKAGEDIVPSADAPRILFAGDSMMQGVAPIVIAKAAKLYPKGYFSDLSKPSTGLTVKRYFDWPTKIKDEIVQRHFDTVVIFLGPNDPWDIMDGGKRYIFPSDEWVEKYRSRVAEVLEYSKSKGVHVIWVGLPNMRNDRIRKGAMVENQVFHEETSRFGYDYLSTEEILGSLDEPFSRHINLPSKGKVAVRAEDGIHFTPEGLRLIGARLFELIAARRNG